MQAGSASRPTMAVSTNPSSGGEVGQHDGHGQRQYIPVAERAAAAPDVDG